MNAPDSHVGLPGPTLQRLLEVAPDAVIVVSPSGQIVLANELAARMFGYPHDELVGQSVELLVPERLRAAHEADRTSYAQEPRTRPMGEGRELSGRRKDGSEFTVEISLSPLPSEGEPLVIAIIRDATQRRQAERLLQEKRAEASRRLLDQATVALASSLDISETIERASRFVIPELADACLVDLAEDGELSQVAASHVDPDKEALARQLGRERVPRLPRGSYQVFMTGKPEVHPSLDDPGWSGELLGADHSPLLRDLGVVSYLCVPIKFRGRTLGVLSLLRGAPARRYTANDVAVAHELAQRIGLAVDNARLYREAQDAIRARDEFLQIASHELKTPLTPLQIQLDLLERALLRAGAEERLVARVRAASRQTARLGRLVESLLDVSRITAGRIHLEPEPFDLSVVVRELVDRFREEARHAGSDLHVFAASAIVGEWDRLRVEQIVANLLSNAIKYGAGKAIEINVRGGGGTARVAVADRGIGIEKDALERVFGRFERAVSVRHYGGLGLGLYIARQLAEAHGGTIVAQSQPGVGSTFTLVLPHTSAPRTPSQGASP